jgi:curved DNA-binding protein CbpA
MSNPAQAPTHAKTHYTILGLTPWANEREIRQSYRELSKLYHPDTTELPTEVAVEKFRQINIAYDMLSNPERRSSYDQSIQFSRFATVQVPNSIVASDQPLRYDSGLPSERPLSGGEMFSLLILFFTFVACFVLVVLVGLTRGDRLLPGTLLQVFNYSN